MAIRYTTIETIHDDYFEVAFQSQVRKLPQSYDGGTASNPLRTRIELTRAARKCRVNTVAELIDAVEKLGMAPQDYAAREPVTLARAVSFLGEGRRAFYRHPLFEELLAARALSITDYIPRWEAPFLIWYVYDSSDRGYPFHEQKLLVSDSLP